MSELGIRSTARRREIVSERGRATLERFPRVYIRLAKRRTPARTRVDETTDLLIEGYPRSGNSFLVSWIVKANPGLRVASHMHSIAHVHAAIRRRVPVVVVVRHPEAAIASLAVFSPDQPLDRLIDRYQRFHHGVVKVADEVVISPFPVTTQSPERVIDALQLRMAVPLTSTPRGGVDEVMADVEHRTLVFDGAFDDTRVSRPSDARKAAIERVCEQLHARHRERLARLENLHDELTGSSNALTVD